MSGDSSLGIGIGLALKSYGRAFRGLLNEYPGAAAAYSLRKLSSSTSNVVRVRRSLDDAEESFTAAEVSDGTLLDFCNNGTSDLYGKQIWFDGSVLAETTTLGSYYADNDIIEIEFSLVGFSSSGNCFLVSVGQNVSNDFHVFYNSAINELGAELSIAGTNYGLSSTIAGVPDGTYIAIANKLTNTISIEYPDGTIYSSSSTAGGFFSHLGSNDLIIGNRPTLDRGTVGVFTSVTVRDETSTDVLSWDGTSADATIKSITFDGSPELYTGQGFDGFVTTWYDQSGNGNDAVQPTTTNQPQIVASGALIAGGLDFDGVDDALDLSGSGLDIFKNVGYGQVFTVVTPDRTFTGSNRYFEALNNSTAARFLLGDSQDYGSSSRIGGRRLDGDAFVDIESPTSHGNNETLITGFLNWAESDAYLYFNGNEVASSTSFQTDGNTSDTSSSAAAIGGTGVYGDFKVKELIIYNSDQSANRTAIEDNINAHYSIYP